MIQFELKFKNKPVEACVEEDGVIARCFDNEAWLLLETVNGSGKYKIKDGNFSPAKEDFALLDKLVSIGLREYERTQHFQIECNSRSIEVQKNEAGRYYIKFPEGNLFMIAQRDGTGAWYQEQFDEPKRPITDDLQTLGLLIRDREEELLRTVNYGSDFIN